MLRKIHLNWFQVLTFHSGLGSSAFWMMCQKHTRQLRNPQLFIHIPHPPTVGQRRAHNLPQMTREISSVLAGSEQGRVSVELISSIFNLPFPSSIWEGGARLGRERGGAWEGAEG